MSVPRYRPARLFVTEKPKRFEPVIASTPELPVIDWSGVGQVAPTVVSAGSGSGLPAADLVVMTSADAEWAAMEHVFCASGAAMPCSDRGTGSAVYDA